MGIRSRRKGARVENEIVHRLQEHGIAATKRSRMYLSGHDLDVPIAGRDVPVEVKARASFKTLEGYFKSAKIVVLKPNRGKPIVMLDWDYALEKWRELEALK